MAYPIKPGLVVKADHINNESVALPFANRVPHPQWRIQKLVMWTPIRVDMAHKASIFEHHDHFVRKLDNLHRRPMEIIQLSNEVIMMFEYARLVRHIYTDGRPHDKFLDPPLWMGDSIGKWEGDTLVVDVIGFNDKTWLDRIGHPHSDALHVVERIRRVDHGTLEDDITIDDPKAYKKPWTIQSTF